MLHILIVSHSANLYSTLNLFTIVKHNEKKKEFVFKSKINILQNSTTNPPQQLFIKNLASRMPNPHCQCFLLHYVPLKDKFAFIKVKNMFNTC
jgi:hypothetical protein